MMQSRRLGPAITLILVGLLVAFLSQAATIGGLLPHQGPTGDDQRALAQAILIGWAALLMVGGSTLLTRAKVGLPLARIAAWSALVAASYLIFWLAFIDTSAWRVLSWMYVGGIAFALAIVGVAVLRALRDRPA